MFKDNLRGTDIYVWEADKATCVLQIIHGAMEHLGRYYDFATFLNKYNYTVVGADLPGHGQYFENGIHNLVSKEDIFEQQITVNEYIKKKYPNLKIIILGHSMGSIVARNLILQNNFSYDKIVLSGTFNTSFLKIKSSIVLQNFMILVSSKNKANKIINYLTFGRLASMSEKKYQTRNWLTNSEDIYLDYKNDPLCGQLFSNNYIKELLLMIHISISKKALEKLNNHNTFILSGSHDPVSNFSKDIKILRKKLDAIPKDNIQILEGMKHEILNDLDKDQVYLLILDILKK